MKNKESLNNLIILTSVFIFTAFVIFIYVNKADPYKGYYKEKIGNSDIYEIIGEVKVEQEFDRYYIITTSEGERFCIDMLESNQESLMYLDKQIDYGETAIIKGLIIEGRFCQESQQFFPLNDTLIEKLRNPETKEVEIIGPKISD